MQSIYVLRNDSVDNLVKNLELLPSTTNGTIEIIKPDVGNTNTWYFNYTPNSTYYQYLNASQSAIETFTYRVTDADGDQDTAIATITIIGVNDIVNSKPEIEGKGRIANVKELINLNYDNLIIKEYADKADSGLLGSEYNYLHVRTGQFYVKDLDETDDIQFVNTTDDGTDYLGVFTPTFTGVKNTDGKYLVTWEYKVKDRDLDPLMAATTGTHSKDQTYTLNFTSGTDTLSADVVIHLDGRDEIEFTDVTSGNNIFEGNSYQKTSHSGNDVLYLANDKNMVIAGGADYVAYGGSNGNEFFMSRGNHIAFGGNGDDFFNAQYVINSSIIYGGNGTDTVTISHAVQANKDIYIFGGDGSDAINQFTNSSSHIDHWFMDFNSSNIENGGDKIYFNDLKQSFFTFPHNWSKATTFLLEKHADSSHSFLSDGAIYYELRAINPYDSKEYSVLNLVGADITLDSLFANGNLPLV